MKKILFLGDSITDSGYYVALIDTYFKVHYGLNGYRIDNIGLSSENTSGLVEKGHIKHGKRPNIADRIDAILDYYADTDIIVILYGINDAIYMPYSTERFEKFKEGMTRLLTKCLNCGLKIYLCTPTAYDAKSAKAKLIESERDEDYDNGGIYYKYDEVMGIYAEYIRNELSNRCDKIIDIYKYMKEFLIARHSEIPTYNSGDGIHPNEELSAVMATVILRQGFDDECDMIRMLDDKAFADKFRLVHKRLQTLHNYEKSVIAHQKQDKVIAKLKKKTERKVKRYDKRIAARL